MSHDHPAIHYEDLSGDVRSEIRCEEPDNSGNVIWCAKALERYLLRERRARFGCHGRCHVGLDKARRDDIREDIARRELLRHGLRETDEPRLARGVVGLALVADDADDARNVDDAAPATLHHTARRRANGDECAAQIGVDDGIPVVVLEPHQQVVARQAGVIDQNIHGTEIALDIGDELRDRLDFTYVAAKALCSATRKLGRHLGGAALVTANDGDPRATEGERFRDGATDTPSTARYERGSPRQVNLHDATRPTSCSISATVPHEAVFTTGAIFFTSPTSTVPGPISTKSAFGKSCASVCTSSVQRTGLVSCRTSRSRPLATVVTGAPSTLAYTGKRGSTIGVTARLSVRPLSALCISGEWNAPLTLSRIARLAPAPFASVMARSTAFASPLMTIWPGAL